MYTQATSAYPAGWAPARRVRRLWAVGLLASLPLIGPDGHAQPKAKRPRPNVMLKTGNLTILPYRKAFLAGKNPQPLDPLLRDPDYLAKIGMQAVEDYLTWDVLEPKKGRLNWAPYEANAKRCAQLGLHYAIYPWVHFFPDWVAEEPGFTPFVNLVTGKPCRQLSGWAPFTRQAVDRLYRLVAEKLGGAIRGVYVGYCADYGELGYPLGYTKWLRADPEAGKGWWCGDAYARADFRLHMLARYGCLERLNRAWGTSFRTPEQIDYPPVELLTAHAQPLELSARLRRRLLDFITWYQDAPARHVKQFAIIAQRHLPNRAYEVKLGHGVEPAYVGYTASSACRILKGVPNLAIRSTHAAIGYPQLKRVASAAKFYGYPFLSEPPGKVPKDKMAERIFNDACCGVSAYFDYPGNPYAAGEAFSKNITILDGSQALVDIACFFPEADHFLRIEQDYPQLWFEMLNPLRDVADYDIVDERMIADGALGLYKLLILYGYPLVEQTTIERLNGFLADGGWILWFQHPTAGQEQPDPDQPNALRTVEGKVLAVEAQSGGKGKVAALRVRADSADALRAVQGANRVLLASRGLPEAHVELLTRRDGVWAGLFAHRILLYNAAGKPVALPPGTGVATIGPREILTLPR